MDIKIKNGERSIRFNAAERRCLSNAAELLQTLANNGFGSGWTPSTVLLTLNENGWMGIPKVTPPASVQSTAKELATGSRSLLENS